MGLRRLATSSARWRCGSRTRSRRRPQSPGPWSPSGSSRSSTPTRFPEVRIRGSIGQSDLAAMADLADGFLGGLELLQGEAIALLNQSSFSTGWGALAVNDALELLAALDVAGALDLEALRCEPLRSRSCDRDGPTVPRRPLDPRTARRAARRRGGGAARAPGSADVPDAAADERRSSRRVPVRVRAARGRAERGAGESAW